jgi:hypothetical protein
MQGWLCIQGRSMLFGLPVVVKAGSGFFRDSIFQNATFEIVSFEKAKPPPGSRCKVALDARMVLSAEKI